MRAQSGHFAALLSIGIIGSLATAACSPPPEESTVTVVQPSMPTRLQVVNKSAADMEIYAVQGGQSFRLGVAAAGRTTEFPLNGLQQAVGGNTRYEARQMANSGVVVNSQSSGSGTAVILEIPAS
jgi:hypothetical protein